jgi:hypothetical protein
MQRSWIDPTGRSFLLITGAVRMPREQVIGFQRREATQLCVGVAVGNSDATAIQSDERAALKTCASYLFDRLTDAPAVPVTVPEHNVARELAAFVHDRRGGQVAAVNENLRSGRYKTIDRRPGSVHLIMGV